MKLTDFFIGGRQFFGFLIPGVIWLLAFFPIAFSEPLEYSFNSMGFMEIVLFFFIAYIAGAAIESLSFKISVKISAILHHDHVSNEKNDKDYFPLSISPSLINRCRKIAAKNVASSGMINNMSNREFSQYCKLSVIENSATYGSKISEYESEINLLAMLPVPLIIFAISFVLFSCQITSISHLSINNVLISLFALILSILLLYRLHPLRCEEAKWWFHFYLMIEDKIDNRR